MRLCVTTTPAVCSLDTTALVAGLWGSAVDHTQGTEIPGC